MITEKEMIKRVYTINDGQTDQEGTNLSVDLIKIQQNLYKKNCITLEIFSIKITD